MDRRSFTTPADGSAWRRDPMTIAEWRDVDEVPGTHTAVRFFAST
jgi:hypothetical protein